MRGSGEDLWRREGASDFLLSDVDIGSTATDLNTIIYNVTNLILL